MTVSDHTSPALARPPSLKPHYRSGKDDLALDFFQPCLRRAKLYRRAVGYFSTSALLSWTDALLRLASEGTLRAQLIASPELSPADAATLRSLTDPSRVTAYQSVIVERVIEEILALLDSPSDRTLRANVFAWLIANDRLELKFAFPTHVDDVGIFHEKIGIFDFANGEQVAFTGSANETMSGHRRNYESIDVYRDWIEGERSRVEVKVDQFDEAWENLAEGLSVLSPSKEVVTRLRERAPRALAKSTPEAPALPSANDPRWAHQDEAVAAFLQARAGILEMATGVPRQRQWHRFEVVN